MKFDDFFKQQKQHRNPVLEISEAGVKLIMSKKRFVAIKKSLEQEILFGSSIQENTTTGIMDYANNRKHVKELFDVD